MREYGNNTKRAATDSAREMVAAILDMRDVETCFSERPDGDLCESAQESVLLTEQEDFVVEAADDAEENYSGYCPPHSDALGASRFESGNDRFVIAEEHGFDHKQIVEERHDGVDQRYQYEYIESNRCGSAQCAGKDKEFREESGKGRNTSQREHGKHHYETQVGIALIKTAIVCHIKLACGIFDCLNNAESGKV